MRILITGLVKGKQITRFREEAEKRGHIVDGCYAKELVIQSGTNYFEPTLRGKALTDYDLIYLCTGIEAKKRLEWYIAASFLKDQKGVKIVNEVAVNPRLNYYPNLNWFFLKQFEKGFPQPKTVSILSPKSAAYALGKIGTPAILKLADLHQGKGVFLVKSLDELTKVIKENESSSYTIREFIPNDGDIRVFVVGGRAIGAMKRVPKEGEFRSNISLGGKGEKFDLDKHPEIKNLAEAVCKSLEIEIAGVDIILHQNTNKLFILEVNIGPQFEGLGKYTGVNAAGAIVEYFENKIKNSTNEQ